MMRTIERTILSLALLGAACAPRNDRRADTPMEQGRTYTTWLYQSQYHKLWDRFSPEMRQTFGSVTDLASFAGRAVTRLGTERGAVDERVVDEKPFHVYARTASFDHARRPVLIQWSLAADGKVTGFAVGPAPSDTATRR